MSAEGAVAVDEMFEEGRRAWPNVLVARHVFEQCVAQCRSSKGGQARLHAADLYLACACAHGDSRALEDFERRYLSEVSAYLARTNATARFVDDVKQQVRERLFVEGKIQQYSGEGTLGSWLRVVTVRVAANMRVAEKRHAELDEAIPGIATSPELAAIQRRYGPEFRTAFRDAIARLGAEDRTLLRLHYLEGLNIGSIATVFHVGRATIGRRVLALRKRLIADVNQLLRERLNATSTELESLLRVVRSDLDVSLSAVLREE